MSGFCKAPSISDFQLIKPISRGAFGKVFLARKLGDEKLYAVKIVSKEVMRKKNLVDKVTAERDALALSKCPYIVHLYYSLQSLSHVYLIMEYLIGGDLKTLIMVTGYLKEAHAAIYTVEISIALKYLHAHGIIHRDLKPDNVLITSSGHLKLTDFGLSTITLNRRIQPSDLLDTPSVSTMPLEYYRTPGQLISLTTELSFSDTPAKNLTPEFSQQLSSGSTCPVVSSPGSSGTTTATKTDAAVKAVHEQSSVESMATELAAQLDYDKQERKEWRQTILKAIENVKHSESWLVPKQNSKNKKAASTRVNSALASFQRNSSLSEIVHEDSLLTLTEIFAGATQEELEEIKKFVSEYSTTQLLCAGLLVRQLSMPVFGSPPLGDTASQNSTVGPLRRSRSCSHSNSHEPYHTKRGRRLYGLRWSPTFKTSKQFCHSACLRRATLPPLPSSPGMESDDPMDGQKNNLEFPPETGLETSTASSQTVHNVPRSPNMTRKRSAVTFGSSSHVPLPESLDISPLSSHSGMFPECRQSPQVIISPLRSELGHLHLTSYVSCSPEPDKNQDSLSTTNSRHPSLSGVQETRPFSSILRRKTVPDLPFSSIEKIRLQQFYSPAQLSVEDLRYGLNLAEIDPSNPHMPRVSASPMIEGTPLRTPRVFRRHTGMKTHPGNIAISDVRTPPADQLSMFRVPTTNVRSIPAPNFDSSNHADTPLSAAHGTNSGFQCKFKRSVSLRTPPLALRAPPSSPVTPGSVPTAGCDLMNSIGSCSGRPDNERLLGTPEYLAPELLISSSGRGEPETAAVDWWALGVILFEMLTGCTPFADDTVEAVFQNILNSDIPWPTSAKVNMSPSDNGSEQAAECEELSPAAVEIITGLLSRSPADRLAVAARLRSYPFLSAVGDWDQLDKLEMPFIPCPDNSTDTSYFQIRNELNDYQVSYSGTDLQTQRS
ncbi:unnamed protein product [Calicophoron daubneyi]|uniref:Serine/threonine-protein kinase greatwall n=1 Tax=Calicophoron daubneyi TaxID=300641 RepID=A0AAV2TJR7_CALDB